MLRPSRVLRLPTERTWSWATGKKEREPASFAPLKVLFCGSDNFSVPSFTMLRELHLRRNDIISSLAVITPPDRLSGRGMKLKACPMTILAKETKYPITHVSRNRLQEGDLPEGEWDLLIAVSFGYMISSSVLSRVKHGGINVHPSFLPRYRGAAPLHRALLNNDKETGVSVQTLHPTRFDHGDILMQSEAIPLQDMTLDQLSVKCAKKGSDMLRELLERGYPINKPSVIRSPWAPSLAPKVHKEDMEIDWQSWSASKIVHWDRVLNTLWTRNGNQRIKVADLQHFDGPEHGSSRVGSVRMTRDAQGVKSLVVKCIDGQVSVGRLTVAGKIEKRGVEAKELAGVMLGGSSVE